MQAAGGAALSEPVVNLENPNLDDIGEERHPDGAVAEPRRRTHVRLLVAVAVAVYIVDQITKVIANAKLAGRGPVEVLGPLLRLDLVHNPGAAFGIAGGATVLFSLIAVAVVVVIVRTARTLRSTPWAVALGLLLGGATGNLTDRILRAPGVLRGQVVDFLELPHWPVFNVADMGITCAAVLIALLTLLGHTPEGARRG